jgi:thiamine monophosphate kinase
VGGEDYELLFTAGARTIDSIRNEISPVTVIGDIATGKPGEVSLIDADGKPFHLHGAGWEHFKTGKNQD